MERIIGMHEMAVSRYKCMNIFIRPQGALYNKKKEVIGFTRGNLKTNCVLPKGHSGVCKNVRGEQASLAQVSRDQERINKLEAQIAVLMQAQAAKEKAEIKAKKAAAVTQAVEPNAGNV